MITIESALPLKNIAMNLEAADKISAVIKTAHLLKNDARVQDWKTFYTALLKREEESTTTIGGGLAIPHARGDFSREMAMALARLQTPVGGPAGETRYVIVMAIPAWMAADYLRLVGALARVFRAPGFTAELDQLSTAEELRDLLNARCL